MQTVNTGRDMATHRFPDFTSLQRRQNIDVQLNLDGIVYIPGVNVPPCSCSDNKHMTAFHKVTLSYGEAISQCKCVPLPFPVKDLQEVLHSVHITNAMGRQLS